MGSAVSAVQNLQQLLMVKLRLFLRALTAVMMAGKRLANIFHFTIWCLVFFCGPILIAITEVCMQLFKHPVLLLDFQGCL